MQNFNHFVQNVNNYRNIYMKTNELTIYAILCRNITIFYRQKLTSLVQVQENMEECRNSKWNFSSSCFIADDSHIKVIWLYVVVFSQHCFLHFRDNVNLLKYYPVKVSQN